jgi:hypothetical protein
VTQASSLVDLTSICAASGLLAGKGLAVFEFLKLVLGEQSSVGMTGTAVFQNKNATDFRFEFAADRIQQLA